MEENLQKKHKSQLSDFERIRDFQRKLYLKAKQDKNFRFYVLYDKIRIFRFLKEAYKRVKANKGRNGVDGISFDDIEKYGVDKYLKEIQKELEERTYRPSPVLRVYIPKSNGKKRPLGIPTIKDRIVQMSCKMVIEPIFEADFEDNSYGFRPKRSSKDAIKKIKEYLKSGNVDVLDADLKSYFDNIPHNKLMILIGKRISDKNVIHLIKMWLKASIVEDSKIIGGKSNKKGTPQGGVISPLLANIYLHLLDKIVNKDNGLFKRMGVHIVRYADDFILMSRKIKREAVEYLKEILIRMELEINKEKSKIINALKAPIDFLGFTIRYDKDLYGRDMRYWNIIPSKKSEKNVRENIGNFLKSNGHKSPSMLVKELNMIIRGWINYYSIKGYCYPNKAKRNLRYYLNERLQRYYKRKSQRKSKLYRRKAFKVLINKYGLIDPTKYCFSDIL